MDLLFKNPRYFFSIYFDVPPWQFLLVWMVLFGIFSLLDRQRTKLKENRKWWNAVLVLVITIVLTVCLLTRSRAHKRMLELNPCTTIILLLSGEVHTVRQIISNAVLFIPVGIVLRLRLAALQSIVLGLLLSIIVETLQFVCGIGASELTDVMANTVGAIIGVALVGAFYRIKGRFKE